MPPAEASRLRLQGHFTAPAKRLRVEPRRPPAHGDLTRQFRPQRRKRSLLERAPGSETSDPGAPEGPHMQNSSPIEPPRPQSIARHPLARLLSVLRGDK